MAESALEKAHHFATDPRLVGPLTAALTRAAVNIANEDPATDNHVERARQAIEIIENPNVYVQRFAWAVSTNETVVNAWADGDREQAFSDLQYVTDSVFNAVAGIVTEEESEPTPEPEG